MQAFVLTQAVEMPVYAWRAPREGQDGSSTRWWERLAIAFGASALTHPVVWFTFQELFYGADPLVSAHLVDAWTRAVALDVVGVPVDNGGFIAYAIAAETYAVVTEALYLTVFRFARPWSTALGANMLSVGFGFIYQSLF
jgi:hypothetical protein